MKWNSVRNHISSVDWLDQVGGCVSTACAIHCAMKPLLFILPSFAWFEFILNEQFEGYMITTGILLAVTSVYWGYCQHRQISVWATFFFSLVLLLVGRILVSHALELYFVIPGGLGLAFTHFLNIRARQLCQNCRTSAENSRPL